MNKRLISLGPYLVPLSAVGGGLIIVLLVALVGRIFRSCRRPRLLGTVHPTPRYISNWLPLATPRPHIPPGMPTDQVGDANDGVTSSTTFSLDGREESLMLPPPAATQPGKKARSILGDHGPSTLAIHMDGAERWRYGGPSHKSFSLPYLCVKSFSLTRWSHRELVRRKWRNHNFRSSHLTFQVTVQRSTFNTQCLRRGNGLCSITTGRKLDCKEEILIGSDTSNQLVFLMIFEVAQYQI